MFTRTLIAISFFAVSGLALSAGLFNSAEATPPARPDNTLPDNISLELDHDFQTDQRTCEVGIARADLCFGTSPLARHLTIGEPIPGHVPTMPAELPILIKLGQPYQGHDVHRYGQSLVLVREHDNVVIDIVRLS